MTSKTLALCLTVLASCTRSDNLSAEVPIVVNFESFAAAENIGLLWGQDADYDLNDLEGHLLIMSGYLSLDDYGFHSLYNSREDYFNGGNGLEVKLSFDKAKLDPNCEGAYVRVESSAPYKNYGAVLREPYIYSDPAIPKASEDWSKAVKDSDRYGNFLADLDEFSCIL